VDFITQTSDIVCCAACGVEIGYWLKEDDPFQEHERWSPSCGFIRGLFVGNIPIGSTDQPTTSPEQPTRSRDVCGPHFELRRNSRPERCKYTSLYFYFCNVCAFYIPSLIFNVILQI